MQRELRFTHEDMELFAAASGDRSPLHMDPAFARRTAFGECIVFGGLLTIAMLGLLPEDVLARIRSVRSTFPGPVLPGAVSLVRGRNRPDRPEDWELRLTGRGKLLARVTTSGSDAAPPTATAEGEPASVLAHGLPAEILGEYRTGPELPELARRFGVESLDSAVLDGIAWASHTVGMSIPGFDGLCAAVTIVAREAQPPPAAPPRQRLRLRDYDARSDRLLIDGALTDQAGSPRCLGVIECFPFAPTPLPGTAALTSSERLDEPARGTVVVVGGSRGLGAALALTLLARGYHVHVIYSSSTEAATELRRLAGPFAVRLFAHRADAADPASMASIARSVGESIDGLALCAAGPPLPMALTGESAVELADHVARDVRLAAVPLGEFLPRLRRQGGWILFASAPAVIEPPRDLPQFTAAKAAVEGLARWAASTTPDARIVVARSPKLRTDLVNTPSARLAATPPQTVAVALLDHLAEEQSSGLSIVEPGGIGAGVP